MLSGQIDDVFLTIYPQVEIDFAPWRLTVDSYRYNLFGISILVDKRMYHSEVRTSMYME